MSLTTGQVADEAGVKNDTVRYYEDRGLIEEPPRLDNGYRQFPPETVRRIRFIKRAQELGFTLSEIDGLLELIDGTGGAGDLLLVTEEKISEIDQKIQDLTDLRSSLRDLAETCPGEGPLRDCSIFSTLTAGTDGEPV